MIKNISYKKKFRLLIAGIIVLTVLIYNLSIKRTLDQSSFCSDLESNLATVENIPNQIVQLNNQIEQLDNIFGKDTINNNDHRSVLINKCSDYCKKNNIRLIQINEPIIEIQDDLTIETNIIQFSSSFKKLLTLLNELENSNIPGNLSSISFKKHIDRRSKRESLQMKIYLQCISKNLHDEKK